MIILNTKNLKTHKQKKLHNPSMLNFIKKLLEKQETHKVPFIQAELKRTEKEIYDFEEWKDGQGFTDFNQIISEQFALSKEQKNIRSICTFMRRSTANGFVLYPSTVDLSAEEFRFYMDYLHQKVLGLGYRKYLSDYKQYVRKDHVQRIERHYVKPKLTRDPNATQANQRYGNITIELEFKDEEVKYLKLLASVYQDRLYSEPLPFEGLLEKVFI